MTRPSLSGFKDTIRRPRYIIWSGVAILAIAAFMIVALGATSTYWFCANGCHKVQDDTIIAFDNSSHSEISCMACHMPVNADPVTFLLHKAEALGELYLTATNTFELPLNPVNHVAFEMESEQCSQCHTENRRITPTKGIIIDHAVHAENDVQCALCHNRVAHPEDFDLTLSGNEKHFDFMEMTACFRCHGHESDALAPGSCSACHPDDFELKPENHFDPNFYTEGGDSAGHAQLALSENASSTAADEEASHEEESSQEGDDGSGIDTLPSPDEIFYCETCHAKSFCQDCHGIPMPHPADFQEGHGELGNSSSDVCANCHAKGGASSAGTEFCNSCHHPEGNPAKSWIAQHFTAVGQSGAAACFECHSPTFCAECHVRGSND